MNLLEFLEYLCHAYNIQFHLHRAGKEWEVVFGADALSTIRGKGKTLAEALAKVLEIR